MKVSIDSIGAKVGYNFFCATATGPRHEARVTGISYIAQVKPIYDYIIVGFGLAGAALALQLRKRGRTVVIYDEPYEHQASRVAAGLFNPITGKVMQKTWNAEKLFPYLHEFYREAEKLTGEQFFFPKPICIPFVSIEEQNYWMTKESDFIEEVYAAGRYKDVVKDPFGAVVLKHSGYLDTTKYLEAVKELFDYRLEPFNYEEHKKHRVVFCEGVKVKQNPFFNWAPVIPLKGETLTIRLGRDLPLIFNRGVYVVPTGGGMHRVGSTYSHDTKEGPSDKGKSELRQKLGALMTIPYTFYHHDWGVRPTTPDRKPLVGRHPEHENMWIFNGLGTKGVSLAPWSSGMLCDAMENHVQIENSINISRFYALYSKF